MSSQEKQSSVGIVIPKQHHFTKPLTLACGETLDEYTLPYETYGELNDKANNAVLICHALTGNHHAAGYHSEADKKPGWWDTYIGPGKAIDTNHFFVVSLNNIGGCHGATGPTSTNPKSGKQWGADFPTLRCRDWVNSQYELMKALGITQWAAVVGGSLGGMQAMRWSLMYPDALKHCVVIASAMKLTAQNLAFNEVARQAILSDPDYHNGHYADLETLPKNGLRLARMVGHITYLSESGMGNRFGREIKNGNLELGSRDDVEFQVQSYLRYQGESFSTSFDANSYILMTRALDIFDLARDFNDDPVEAFTHATCKYLVVSFTSDWRFAPSRSKEIVDALITAKKSVCYAEIDADRGHDAFLLDNERYQTVFGNYMQRIAEEIQ